MAATVGAQMMEEHAMKRLSRKASAEAAAVGALIEEELQNGSGPS